MYGRFNSYLCDVNGIKTEIASTADGWPTLYRPDIDEHYHSVKGAVAESLHVYVNCGLLHRATNGCRPTGSLRVLEIGFGTGLNAALSVDVAGDAPVHYIALELYPPDPDVIVAMGYGAVAPLFGSVNAAAWNEPVVITPKFTLEKRCSDFLACRLPESVDVVYYDAFAPEKQPEMWSRGCFQRIYDVMNPDAVLTTYCAKGCVRRLLADVGFTVERLAGPAGGKREILRATKQ